MSHTINTAAIEYLRERCVIPYFLTGDRILYRAIRILALKYLRRLQQANLFGIIQ